MANWKRNVTVLAALVAVGFLAGRISGPKYKPLDPDATRQSHKPPTGTSPIAGNADLPAGPSSPDQTDPPVATPAPAPSGITAAGEPEREEYHPQFDLETFPAAATTEVPADTDEPVGDIYTADATGIDGAIRERLSDILDCYKTIVHSNPDVGGRITLNWVIPVGEEGQVVNPADVRVLDSQLGHVILEGCMATIMEELAFEAPTSDAVVVNYPFELSTE